MCCMRNSVSGYLGAFENTVAVYYFYQWILSATLAKVVLLLTRLEKGQLEDRPIS